MMSNARAKNAARAQQKEATRALWSARKRRVMALLGKAKNGAVAVSRKVGSGLATGGLALAGAAAAAAGAAARGAKMVAGKAYGAAGAAAARAAAAAKAAAAKVRSYSVGRRLSEGGAAAVGKLKAAARMVTEKTKAAVSATRKALGVAGAAISKGANFLGKKAGNARNYASRKVGNLRKGLSNMYTRMRYGGHEARLDAERQRAANAVNATKAALNRNSSAKAKAAGKTLGEIAAKLKKADVAAANGSNAAAATAIGAAATAAKTASKKGWFSKLGNAAKNFTRGVGARLGKLRNMFKGTKKNNGPKSAMFKGSIVTNPGYTPTTRKNAPKNAYGLPVKAAEGRSARKLMNVLAGRSEGAKPLMFGLPAPMSRSAAARRFA